MKAKEIFEKLGFKCDICDDQITYYKTIKHPITKEIVEYNITFYLDIKRFECFTNKIEYANDLGIEELQAINKQVEELGWK